MGTKTWISNSGRRCLPLTVLKKGESPLFRFYLLSFVHRMSISNLGKHWFPGTSFVALYQWALRLSEDRRFGQLPTGGPWVQKVAADELYSLEPNAVLHIYRLLLPPMINYEMWILISANHIFTFSNAIVYSSRYHLRLRAAWVGLILPLPWREI